MIGDEARRGPKTDGRERANAVRREDRVNGNALLSGPT